MSGFWQTSLQISHEIHPVKSGEYSIIFYLFLASLHLEYVSCHATWTNSSLRTLHFGRLIQRRQLVSLSTDSRKSGDAFWHIVMQFKPVVIISQTHLFIHLFWRWLYFARFCRWSDILCWSMLISLIHWFVQLSFQSTVQSFVQCSNICSIILSLFSSITCSTTLSVTCLNHLWSTWGHIFISLHVPTHTCSFSCSGINYPLPVICYILLYNTLSLVDLIHLFSRLFSQRFSRIFNHSWHLFSYVNNDLSNHVVIVSWITCSSILPVTCLNHLWSCHIPTLTCSFSCFGIGHTLPVIHYTLLIYVELCWSHLFVQPFFSINGSVIRSVISVIAGTYSIMLTKICSIALPLFCSVTCASASKRMVRYGLTT